MLIRSRTRIFFTSIPFRSVCFLYQEQRISTAVFIPSWCAGHSTHCLPFPNVHQSLNASITEHSTRQLSRQMKQFVWNQRRQVYECKRWITCVHWSFSFPPAVPHSKWTYEEWLFLRETERGERKKEIKRKIWQQNYPHLTEPVIPIACGRCLQ